MKQKKKLLFVIESLTLAGSEKSLISLLNKLDTNLYNIDLQLFNFGGELEKSIPKFVNVLPALDYTEYLDKSWNDNMLDFFSENSFAFFKAKLKYSIGLRMRKRNHSEIARLYWETLNAVFKNSEKEYDVAIAFAQGVPTFYVMDKIRAKRKVTWVNANMQFTGHNKDFQERYYSKFDAIVSVSAGTKEHLLTVFPHLSLKYIIVSDIIDYKAISKMANLPQPYMNFNEFNILTVGRLNNGMKGLDLTIEACKLLRDKGLDFHWYILGKGPYRETMESYIKEHNLENHVSLMGTTANPYPFFKAADLYVQTSRNEGFGLSIAEARLLNTPVVTTRFDTVFNQMLEGLNGLVTDMNAEAVADSIERIMNDKALYNSIVNYLKQEEKENYDSVKNFNGLIDELLKNY